MNLFLLLPIIIGMFLGYLINPIESMVDPDKPMLFFMIDVAWAVVFGFLVNIMLFVAALITKVRFELYDMRLTAPSFHILSAILFFSSISIGSGLVFAFEPSRNAYLGLSYIAQGIIMTFGFFLVRSSVSNLWSKKQ